MVEDKEDWLTSNWYSKDHRTEGNCDNRQKTPYRNIIREFKIRYGEVQLRLLWP